MLPHRTVWCYLAWFFFKLQIFPVGQTTGSAARLFLFIFGRSHQQSTVFHCLFYSLAPPLVQCQCKSTPNLLPTPDKRHF